MLRNGVDAISAIPAARWNSGFFYHPDAVKSGKTYARWGGFVENIDRFDA
jgi:acyl transferase domain-containing protein